MKKAKKIKKQNLKPKKFIKSYKTTKVVKSKSQKNQIGEVIESLSSGEMQIVNFTNENDIQVKFKTGAIIKTTYQNFKNGKVRDPTIKNIFGVGFHGIGEYRPTVNGVLTPEYKAWYKMVQKCHNPYFLNKHPEYINATVCTYWQNFQNFAEWFQKEGYELLDEGVHLNKNIIKKNNLVFCPEYCSFVPSSVLSAVVNKSKKVEFPEGIIFLPKTNKYQVNHGGKNLGNFPDPLKAFTVYKKAKEARIRMIVEKYREVLSVKVYDSLMKYSIQLSDCQ